MHAMTTKLIITGKKWSRFPDKVLLQYLSQKMVESAIFVLQYSILNLMKNKFDYCDILWKSRIAQLQHVSEIKILYKIQIKKPG